MKLRADGRKLLPVAINYRGRKVGVWLGPAFVAAVVLAVAAAELALALGHGSQSKAYSLLWMTVGFALVLLAGLYDDYRPHPTRGVVNQLRMALRGRPTSGVVKLLVVGAASAATVWMLGGRGIDFLLGAAVVAGAANLWNLLDVVPGRAIKWFLPAGVGLLLSGTGSFQVLDAAALVAAMLALPFDLREIAMLGDSGANPMGFVVGVGLYLSLPTGGLTIALGVLLGLHVLAETLTLSRAIEVIPPLRWFDRLGRTRADSGARR